MQPPSDTAAPQRQQRAADPTTAPALLAHLLADGNLHVRRAAAANPHAPADTRALLRDAGATDDFTGLGPPRGAVSPDGFATLVQLGEWSRRLAARHPGCPADVLADLATDAMAAVRRDAARHAATLGGSLALLAADADGDVRAAAAHNARTPPDAVARLVRAGATDDLRGFAPSTPDAPDPPDFDALQSAGPFGIRLAARHPAAPRDLLEKLADHDHWHVRADLAHNPACPAHLLAQLAGLDDPNLRARLAQHPHTPPDVLADLADDPDVRLRAAVAAHPTAPPALLGRLACDGTWAVRQTVAQHPGFPTAERDRLVAAGSTAGLDAFGDADTTLDADTLTHLAARGAWGRQLAARHVNTPTQTLEQLATDGDPTLRDAATRHPAFPPAFRDLMARAGSAPDGQGYDAPGELTAADAQVLLDHGPWARRLLARHAGATQAALDQLARDPDHAVRKQAARHAHLSADAQAMLAQDETHDVRWALARRDDLSADVLAVLASDVLPAIRLAALHHPHATPQLAQRLRFDLDEDVRTAARTRA